MFTISFIFFAAIFLAFIVSAIFANRIFFLPNLATKEESERRLAAMIAILLTVLLIAIVVDQYWQ